MRCWVGFLIAAAAPATALAQTTDREITVKIEPPAAVTSGHAPTGWGAYATVKGRTLDLQARGWAEDAQLQRNDVEVGYGWRGKDMTATFGYTEHVMTPALTPIERVDPAADRGKPKGEPAVFGFNFTIRR